MRDRHNRSPSPAASTPSTPLPSRNAPAPTPSRQSDHPAYDAKASPTSRLVLEWEQAVESKSMLEEIQELDNRVRSSHSQEKAELQRQLEEKKASYREEKSIVEGLQTRFLKIESEFQGYVRDLTELKQSLHHQATETGFRPESLAKLKKDAKRNEVMLERLTIALDAAGTAGLSNPTKYKTIRKAWVKAVQNQLRQTDSLTHHVNAIEAMILFAKPLAAM
jgi:DNA repair exonuclease SbcCD ATPase subunit